MILNELAKKHDYFLKMAKSISKSDAEDLLQNTYLKLYEMGKNADDINDGYVYFTMKSIFYNSIKKKDLFIDELELNLKEIDNHDGQEENIQLLEDTLEEMTNKERLFIKSHFGHEIFNPKTKELEKFEKCSVKKLSRETGIDSNTLYIMKKRILEKLKYLYEKRIKSKD